MYAGKDILRQRKVRIKKQTKKKKLHSEYIKKGTDNKKEWQQTIVGGLNEERYTWEEGKGNKGKRVQKFNYTMTDDRFSVAENVTVNARWTERI